MVTNEEKRRLCGLPDIIVMRPLDVLELHAYAMEKAYNATTGEKKIARVANVRFPDFTKQRDYQ